MGGAGGATTGGEMPSGPAGHADQNPGEVQQFTGMGIQAGMAIAQREVLQAQARNIDTDTELKKSQIPKEQSQTGLNIATTGNIEADTALKKVELELQNFKAAITNATMDDQINMVHQELEKLTGQARSAMAQADVDESTIAEKIDQVGATLLNTYADTAMKKAIQGKHIVTGKQIGRAHV